MAVNLSQFLDFPPVFRVWCFTVGVCYGDIDDVTPGFLFPTITALIYESMKKSIICFLLILSLFCFSGCGGKKKPSDLPPLYPVKITVVQDGNPLEGATVNFIADGANVRFTTAGITDKNGVATIKTDIDWPGVPVGKYKVCISKVVMPPEEPTDASLSYEERRAKAGARSAQTKSLVDSRFLRPRTTTLAIDVTESGATETFDVGAAVDELWERVTGGSSSR